MLEIKNISKSYTDGFGFTIILLNNVSFTVQDAKICSIIAPSGSGKSSLLKIVAGLESASNGEIVNNNSKDVIYIPSEPSSFPWMNVKENIQFGIKDNNAIDIDSIVKIVGLDGYETHFPHSKSLGFRFRISLGRSIAHKPSVIVIDEPFNKMDEETRSELYLLVRNIAKLLNISFLFATTNISEALFLSDQIHLMKKNPGEIFESIINTLPAEREMSIFSSKEFIHLRAQIENSFKSIDSQVLFNISI